MGRKTLHDLSLQVLARSEKAVMVTEGLTTKDGELIKVWLPLSQIEGDLEEGKVCVITIPEWLVIEKGLTVE